jgi:hypothetical protein
MTRRKIAGLGFYGLSPSGPGPLLPHGHLLTPRLLNRIPRTLARIFWRHSRPLRMPAFRLARYH